MLRITFILILFLNEDLLAKHTQVFLQEALDMRLVSAKAKSLGAYQGYCMSLQIKNLSKDSLIVLLEPGRRFNSVNDQFQDILIVKEELIFLKVNQQKNILVKGYCCQASNRCPANGEVYTLNHMADSNLLKVARFLNVGNYESGAEQSAVWAISNKHATSSISSSNDSLTAFLRTCVALLKSEKIPWYYVTSKQYVYSNGLIATVPLILKGKLKYSNDQENYATLFVTNEKGILVCEVKSEWLHVVTNQEYTVELPVKGLPKGKYKVALVSKEKELVREEFEI